MIDWFLRYVVGGKTGTRHSAWFILLCEFAATGVAIWREAPAHVFDLLTATLVVTIPVLIAAHGHHKQLEKDKADANNP